MDEMGNNGAIWYTELIYGARKQLGSPYRQARKPLGSLYAAKELQGS